MNNTKTNRINLIILVISVSVFGLIMQYSASSYSALREFEDAFFYVKKQGIAFLIGIAAMVLATTVDTKFYYKFRLLIYIISLLLLAMVFIPGLGVEKYGAKRWLNLGIFTIQPSEISKFGLIIFISGYLSNKQSQKFRHIMLCLIATLAVCILIMLQPNMSITMLTLISVAVVLLIGGLKIKHAALMAIPLLIAVLLLIFIEPYRMKRILAFIDPWSNPQNEGFQLIQSFYALSNGGIFGVGLFNSRQKYLFLPFAETDFIFSIIGEELGLVGCIAVMLLFLAIAYNGIKIAMNSRDRFESLLSSGIVAIIIVQVLLNIAVVTGSIPPTGLPLPFISHGGSSLVVLMYVVGILIRIGKESDTHLLAKSHKLK